jgi:hypothetical protein
MRGKLWFIGGLAAGFVLGARAGREKYEELVVKGRKVLDHPTVQEAAGVAQAQANRLMSEGKEKLGQTRLGEKLSSANGTGRDQLTSADKAFAGTPASSTGTGTTGTSGKSTGGSTGTGANGSTF